MSSRKHTEQEEDRIAEHVMQAVLDGASLKELRGVSTEQMDGLYAFAYEFYEQGRLDDAEKFSIFSVSTTSITRSTGWGWRRCISSSRTIRKRSICMPWLLPKEK